MRPLLCTPYLACPLYCSAIDYWVDNVIGELATEGALTSGGGAVFFDEVDQGVEAMRLVCSQTPASYLSSSNKSSS